MSPLPAALGRVNKRYLNRLMRHLAPHLPGFALLTHVGRRTGKAYTIPVNVFGGDSEYRVALTYGPRTDWVRNVLAAGGCTLTTRGHEVRLTEPRIVHDPGRSWAPPIVRTILRLLRVPDVLVMRRGDEPRG